MQAVLASRRRNQIEGWTWNGDCLLIERQMGAPHQHSWLHKGEIGVVRQKCFRENNQLNTLHRGLRHGRKHPLNRALETEQNRADLGGCNLDRGGHGGKGPGLIRGSRYRG